MNKSRYTNDEGWVFGLIVGGCFLITMILMTTLYIPNEIEKSYNQAINDSKINITNAYYEGLLYTSTTGKIVYLEKTFEGTKLKEITLEEFCKR